MSSEFEDVAELFSALSSPVRIAILTALDEGDMAVSELVEAVGASQPLVSQHLKILRLVRLVDSNRSGRQNRYYIADEHVSHILRDAITHTREEP